MNVAIIPARGGSKRIPRKNLKEFCGKPMIVWAIELALDSGMFEKVIVSTDDDDISKISNDAGAQTPFIRPKELADDFTPTVPVIAHALELCEMKGWSFDYACCIYPCSPFLKVADLRRAFELMQVNDNYFAYPVTEYEHPIERAMRRQSNGIMEFCKPKYELARTQDLENLYHDVGQFYWGKVSAWKSRLRMHSDGLGVVVPSWRFVDIDNVDDWKRAEIMYEVFSRSITVN